MGRFMIPCCCLCGKCADSYENRNWKWQDFCTQCGTLIEEKYGELVQYFGGKKFKKGGEYNVYKK